MASDSSPDQSKSSEETSPARALIQQERLLAQAQMASGIAHDLNNSLTPIIGYADYLLDPRSGLAEDAKKSLQGIRAAANDIAELVENLRQFYRRRDETELLSSIDLNALVRQSLELTRAHWRDIPLKQGVALDVQMDLEKALPPVIGSPSELRQTLVHLICNAVEAIPSGGTITVSTRMRTPGSANTPAGISLEVRDSGPGMDDATRERCLEPFFSKKEQRGSGLGLAIVYGTVRRHGGQIEVESQPGHGTTIRLLFKAAEHEALTGKVASALSALPSLRILCIDDDWRISSMLQQVLSSEHHLVEVANGGEKGLQAFRKARLAGHPFHVVITDLGMPNIDGRQIVRSVKAESPDTPVVLLTGWAAMGDDEGDWPAGIDALLTKPPSIDRLHEVLAQVTLSKVSGT